MRLSKGQLNKLSDLFMDIAKGLLLAAVAVPTLVKEATIFESIRSTLVGLFFVYLALKTTAIAEVKQV